MNADQEIFSSRFTQSWPAIVIGQSCIEEAHRLADMTRGKTGTSCRDVVLFDREARNDHPPSKPNASPKSDELMQSWIRAGQGLRIESIQAGNFLPHRDENKCRHCTNEMMCEENAG
jgi:hypothetical protein